MTERTIQNALFQDLREKGYLLCCPNYSPAGYGWECDLFAVTRSNMFVEFEIKITRSDFRADSLKGVADFTRHQRISSDRRTKYERLTACDPAGPSRFFYVVPADMIKPEEVPNWAGLIYVHRHASIYRPLTIGTAKPAPKLHREKVADRVVQHMASVMYWRFWSIRTGQKEGVLP